MEIANSIILQIVGIAVAGVCGWLAAQVKRLNARDAALYSGMKALLRKELIDDYEKYVQNGDQHVLTYERKREIDECYDAYKALGGNGTGKKMYEKINEIQVDIMQ